MKLFKDAENNIWAYEEDGSQDHLIGNKIAITKEQADAINQEKIDALPKQEPLTPLQKLASVGLTVDELKTLLGVK